MQRADRSVVAMQPASGWAGRALIVQLRAAANLAAPRLFCAPLPALDLGVCMRQRLAQAYL